MVKKPTKYVFVTGGVLSGLGKGITAASIGNLLKSRGLHINIQKCDPYLNVDAGTLNPVEHGECFVTQDGAETDLDLGHYERFIKARMRQENATFGGEVTGHYYFRDNFYADNGFIPALLILELKVPDVDVAEVLHPDALVLEKLRG